MFDEIRSTALARFGILLALVALVASSVFALIGADIFTSSTEVTVRQHWNTASTSVGIAGWVLLAMVVSHIIWKMIVRHGAGSVRALHVLSFVATMVFALGYLIGERTGPSYQQIIFAVGYLLFSLAVGFYGIGYQIDDEDGTKRPTGGPLFAAVGFLVAAVGSIMPLSGYSTGTNTAIHSGIVVGGFFLVLLGAVRYASNNERFKASQFVTFAIFVFLLSAVAHFVVAILIYGANISYSSLREGSLWVDGVTILAYVLILVAASVWLAPDRPVHVGDDSQLDDSFDALAPPPAD